MLYYAYGLLVESPLGPGAQVATWNRRSGKEEMNVKNVLGILILLCTLTSALAGCGSTPEPTGPAPTPTQADEALTPEPTAPLPTPTQGSVVPTPEPTSPLPTPTKRATPSPEATAEPTQAPGAPRPTNTPTSAPLKYPPPALLGPTDGVPITWGYTVLLEWSSVGDLAEDEYYHLHLDAVREVNSEPWYGDYVYTKDTSYRVEGAFLAPFHPPQEQGRGVVYWWVRVVRKTGEDHDGKPMGVDLSPPSEKRTFITEAKPPDS